MPKAKPSKMIIWAINIPAKPNEIGSKNFFISSVLKRNLKFKYNHNEDRWNNFIVDIQIDIHPNESVFLSNKYFISHQLKELL
jgi:hypothetical protein